MSAAVVEDVVDAEVVGDASEEEARTRLELLEERSKDAELAIEEIQQLITDGYEHRDWVAMGCESWSAYASSRIGPLLPRWATGDRLLVVLQLHEEGLSQRAIASATSTSLGTVNADLKKAGVQNRTPEPKAPRSAAPARRTKGTDGKSYPSSSSARGNTTAHTRRRRSVSTECRLADPSLPYAELGEKGRTWHVRFDRQYGDIWPTFRRHPDDYSQIMAGSVESR